MGDKSKIEWTDATWNPITGCSKVSSGCKNCYAEREFPRIYPGRAFTDVSVHEDRMTMPLRWRRPRRVFVNSLSDLFHESIPGEKIAEILSICGRASQHTFQVLTKRPKRMRDLILDICAVGACVPPPNLWLGVSVEDQKTADERIPLLLQMPAAVRWVSYEPALGSVDLARCIPCGYYCDESVGHVDHGPNGNLGNIDWVVAGGESGPKARPSHPDWFRSVRDQCQAAGVPFFFKQWGEWRPPKDGELFNTARGLAGKPPAFLVGVDGSSNCFYEVAGPRPSAMLRVGKKRAGRLLDGREWNEMPRAVASDK